MRCLTLAKGIQNLLDASGTLHRITFVNSQKSTLLQERYGPCNLNHEVVQHIDSDVGHVDADLWIVDHYQLDETFEQKLSLTGAKVMVIDDLANRPHYCDLLLDVNFFDKGNRYEINSESGIINPDKSNLIFMNKVIAVIFLLNGEKIFISSLLQHF